MYILNVLQNIKIHCVFIYIYIYIYMFIYLFIFNTHCQLSVYDLNLSPLLDSVKRSSALSHATVRSKQTLLRALLYPLLWSISGNMFVTPPTLLVGTDRFPETWVFEKFTTMKFFRADSRIRMWRFSDVSATNSLHIFRTCSWFRSTKTESFNITKPPAHPEDTDGVASRKVWKTWHPDAAFCQRKFHWILSPRKLQDLHYDKVWWGEGGGHQEEHW